LSGDDWEGEERLPVRQGHHADLPGQGLPHSGHPLVQEQHAAAKVDQVPPSLPKATNIGLQILVYKHRFTNIGLQILVYKYWFTNIAPFTNACTSFISLNCQFC
jgi:hypothetical protein